MHPTQKRKKEEDFDDDRTNLYHGEISSSKKAKLIPSYSGGSSFTSSRLSCDSIESVNSLINTGSPSAESSDGDHPTFNYNEQPYFGASAEDVDYASSTHSRSDSGYSEAESVSSLYSDKAKKMMAGMGYKEGKGLGRSEQGTVKPVEASRQQGTRHLGFAIEGLDPMNDPTFNYNAQPFFGASAEDLDYASSTHRRSDSGYSKAESASSIYSDKAKKMMAGMGYKEGKGLGRSEQGIVKPVEASRQRGTRGLGFAIKGLEAMSDLTWDQDKDHIIVDEQVSWLKGPTSPPPSLNVLLAWPEEGPRNKDISGEQQFCDPLVLKGVLSNKSIFDKLTDKELMKARSKCNPFETIGRLFFLNRAALKMANIDSICDFMFTTPADTNGHSLVRPDEVLYFADVCAAPGGFSEYVLWRRKSRNKGFCDSKGFGFTLKENDFKLHDFYAAPAEFFEPHYGISGTEGTGDVYDPRNIANFRKFVLQNTFGRGVHFMMADGGFSVEGQENIQEILSKRLYLCQFLVALGIVRTGGHFVCKLFDVFTPFSVGLVYLMYLSFENISLHKPNSSRPANSERYIICKHKKNSDDVYNYLFEMNLRLESLGDVGSNDLIHLVPLEILKEDQHFYNYIFESNNEFGVRQIIGLQKIQAFCQDPLLLEGRQTSLRRESLEHWQLPDTLRTAASRKNAKDKAKEILRMEDLRMFGNSPANLSLRNFEEMRTLYDFRFVVLTSSSDEARRDKAFFLGLGGTDVYKWNGSDTAEWQPFDTKLELPPDTLVYGELLTEYVQYPQDNENEKPKMKKVSTFHLIDGLILNGFDIRDLHIGIRFDFLRKFALAINKPGRLDLAPIYCKTHYKLENINAILSPPLLSQMMLPVHRVPKRVFCEQEGTDREPTRFTIPTGIMLLKVSRSPFMMAFSKTQQRKYWFNTVTRHALFETVPEAIASFSASYSNGFYYWFEHGVKLLENDHLDPQRLQLSHFQSK